VIELVPSPLLTSAHADPVAVVGKTNVVPSEHDTLVAPFTDSVVQTLSPASTPPMMVGVLPGQ
jgi:hypothetical protein